MGYKFPRATWGKRQIERYRASDGRHILRLRRDTGIAQRWIVEIDLADNYRERRWAYIFRIRRLKRSGGRRITQARSHTNDINAATSVQSQGFRAPCAAS